MLNYRSAYYEELDLEGKYCGQRGPSHLCNRNGTSLLVKKNNDSAVMAWGFFTGHIANREPRAGARCQRKTGPNSGRTCTAGITSGAFEALESLTPADCGTCRALDNAILWAEGRPYSEGNWRLTVPETSWLLTFVAWRCIDSVGAASVTIHMKFGGAALTSAVFCLKLSKSARLDE
eukprot:IDg8753t1